MDKETKYLNVLGNLYYFINYTIFFFNFVSIIFGNYIFIEQIHNNTLISNCNNVNLFNYFGIINAFIILLTSNSLFEVQILAFITNVIMSVVNYINLIHIKEDCMDYYTNNYLKIWIYYLYNIFIQSITNLFYLILISISIRYICYKSEYKKLNIEVKSQSDIVNSQSNIVTPRPNYGSTNNLYDDIPDELDYNN